MTTPNGFDRTSCACTDCVACCKRQPGPLAPGEFEQIRDALGQTTAEAKRQFWASPGALVMDSLTGRQFRIGTITPRMLNGRCVFLSADDRCRIHHVAPFGCAMFDTHMGAAEARRRSAWLARQTMGAEYQAFRGELPPAASYEPTGFREV